MEKFGYGIRNEKHSDPGWKTVVSGIRDGKHLDPVSGINIPDLLPIPTMFEINRYLVMSIITKEVRGYDLY
jgi:hypothetical protein